MTITIIFKPIKKMGIYTLHDKPKLKSNTWEASKTPKFIKTN